MGIILAYWVLYLVMQALFINGIYLASLGGTVRLPNGKIKNGENLLYPLRKFLLQEKKCKTFYSGKDLEQLYQRIRLKYRLDEAILIDGFYFDEVTSLDQYIAAIPLIKTHLLPGVQVETYANHIKFCEWHNEYIYSKWLRKPIIQCVVCMGSFWGIFLFLIPVYIISCHDLIVLPAYLVNTVMLAAANKVVYNLTK